MPDADQRDADDRTPPGETAYGDLPRPRSPDDVVGEPLHRRWPWLRAPGRKDGSVPPEVTSRPTVLPTIQRDERPRVFETVVVAVDFSPQARQAVDTAVGLVGAFNAGITLIHVLDQSVSFDRSSARSRRAERDDRRTVAWALLHDFQDKLPDGIVADCLLREGEPATEIVLAARQLAANLIVIGTHGKRATADFLLGNTAESVLRHAPCPVLTVGRAAVETPPVDANTT
jgi:universal stress protein A